MSKRQPTIRIANPIPYETSVQKTHPGLSGLWVEQFRYMGFLRVIKEYDGNHEVNAKGHLMDGYEFLEITPPKDVDGEAWCRMNADRMSSFGINAVVAPKWGTDPQDRIQR